MRVIVKLKSNDVIAIENIKSIKYHGSDEVCTNFDNFILDANHSYTFIGDSSLNVFGSDILYVHFQ